MAYEYKKLSEVDAITSADSDVNLIVEHNDEIKKLSINDLPIPTGQVQADWNEEDETKASFIKNKPDLSQVGGSGGEFIWIKVDYNGNADWTYADGTAITPETLKKKFESGANVYVSHLSSGYGDGTNVAYHMSHVVQYVYVPRFEISGSLTRECIELYYYSKLGYESEPNWRTITCYGEY